MNRQLDDKILLFSNITKVLKEQYTKQDYARILDECQKEFKTFKKTLHKNITLKSALMVETWTELLAHYILFLRGVLPSSITHAGPLYTESQTDGGLFEGLVRNNFLTMDSQPANCDETERYRSYVRGLLYPKHLNLTEFISSLTEARLLVRLTNARGDQVNNYKHFQFREVPDRDSVDYLDDDVLYEDVGVLKPGYRKSMRNMDETSTKSRFIPGALFRLDDGKWTNDGSGSFDMYNPHSVNEEVGYLMEACPHLKIQSEDLFNMEITSSRFCHEIMQIVLTNLVQSSL